ncbi:NAD(P)H-binding protein [Pseudoxanthomonas putridarboris]|uniref:NAD(P)H-binding protein n=1 Tax=Pseudoxanthomonas putridarboris TaxID=752605 RepID=A0ABU9J1Q1_9GAMM
MRVILFGATGMVGQGVLRECLLADDVAQVLVVGRTPSGVNHPKLREIVQADLFEYGAVEEQLRDYDACFFTLGVSAGGMDEAGYTRITHDLTLSAAHVLVRLNPAMTFVYVSGAGTDDSERGRAMWARVKGRTENALKRLPFKAVYLLRPGAIQPLHGARSSTRAYRWLYTAMAPVLPLLRRWFPHSLATTETMGKAMLALARHGWPESVLAARDIEEASRHG